MASKLLINNIKSASTIERADACYGACVSGVTGAFTNGNITAEEAMKSIVEYTEAYNTHVERAFSHG